MICGGAVIAPAASVFDTGIVASAANSSPVVNVGDYQYVLYDNGTAHVVGFTGTKNQSTTNVGMPSVVYAKDVSTSWTYLQYNSTYKVTQLEASIFNGCKFKTLSLPSNLQALTGGFNGAEIGGFFIDSSNSYFSSYYYSGAYALYNKSQTTLYAYPSNPSLYVSGFGNETKGFPSTMTRIEDQAFASSKLTKVTIFTVEVVESLPLTNISYLSAYSVPVGKTVTAAGRFVGGTKPVTYEFYFKRSANTKWNKLSYGNEKGTYAKFTPTTAAEYDIKVVATDANNTKAEKIFKLTAE